MKNVFGTSLFWIVIFGWAIFYIKLFDAALGTQVATWFASAPVAIQDMSGMQSSVMSGIATLEATNMQMQVTLDAIANKLGVSSLSETGAQGILATGSAASGTIILDKPVESPTLRR